MAKKTRKEDAASIVGASLAEEIDAKSKIAPTKSDVLVEMSENETPEETEELIAEAEESGVPEVPAKAVVEESMNEKDEEVMEGEDEEHKKKKMDEKSETVIEKSFEEKVLEMLTALTEKSFAVETKSDVQAHPLQVNLDALLSAVDNSLGFEGDVSAKLQAVQPTLTELGNAITDYVTQKSVAIEPPAPNENNDNLLDKITELIQPLSQTIEALRDKVGLLEAKSSAQSVEVSRPRIPQPRSLQSSVIQKAQTEQVKPGSIKDIVRKSVGITD